MKTLIGGAVATVLGIVGLSIWFKEFLMVLAGTIPVTLLMGGGLAIYLGFDEMKDNWKKDDDAFDSADSFDDVMMVKNGVGCGIEAESKATEVLKKAEFTLTVDLNMGTASHGIFTCDFSVDYVKINADYRS